MKAMVDHDVAVTPSTKGARTAVRLLDAAEMLFAQKGYDATSLRDVAAAVDIRQPGLYRHFENKEALYRQVLERALQPLVDVMEDVIARSASEASYRTLTHRLLDVMADRPNAPLLMIRAVLSTSSYKDEIGMEWVERIASYGRRVTQAAAMDAEGADVPFHIVAIFNLLFGYFWAAPLVQSLSGGDPLAPDMIERQKALLTGFLSSIDPAETRPATGRLVKPGNAL